MIKERPMLFSPPMAIAIDEGRKTQTRRIINAQPIYTAHDGTLAFADEHSHPFYKGKRGIKCPYGKIGDHLWVKENWRTLIEYNHLPPRDIPKSAPIEYVATDPFVDWGRTRPNIFMCRWMSRFLLEITDIRVQRVQDITREDAKAEGITEYLNEFSRIYHTEEDDDEWRNNSTIENFKNLWDSINDNWDFNPWVWALTFKRI